MYLMYLFRHFVKDLKDDYDLYKLEKRLVSPRIIRPFSVVRPERLKMGAYVLIQRNCHFHCDGMDWCKDKGGIVIGNNCSISENNVFYGAGEIEIGDFTVTGPGTMIFSSRDNYSLKYAKLPDSIHQFAKVTIGAYVKIFSNVIIAPGVTIGDGAVIGAGSVVMHDVPAWSIAFGSPARVIAKREQDVPIHLRKNKNSGEVIIGYDGNDHTNWDKRAGLNQLQAVLDSNDRLGFKNVLIDSIHIAAISKYLNGSRRLLDFGCGTGRFAKRIRGMQVDYFGVDSSQGMIDSARKSHEEFAEKFYFYNGTDLPFPDQHFDYCLSCGVWVYLVYDAGAQRILKEIHRVLKPSGKLLLLEQASQSGGKSGSVGRSSTESDYMDILKDHFRIIEMQRVRTSDFTMLTKAILKVTRCSPPMRSYLPKLLSAFEGKIARFRSDSYLKSIPYYDFLIYAEKM